MEIINALIGNIIDFDLKGIITNIYSQVLITFFTALFLILLSKFSSQNYKYQKFSGKWYGIHMTKTKKVDGFIISKHLYYFIVNKHGKIQGEFFDFIPNEKPKPYLIEGKLIPNGIVFTATYKYNISQFATHVLYSVVEDELEGIISSIDYCGKPFVSKIILKKNCEPDIKFYCKSNESDVQFYSCNELDLSHPIAYIKIEDQESEYNLDDMRWYNSILTNLRFIFRFN